jgi:hypothetical protein
MGFKAEYKAFRQYCNKEPFGRKPLTKKQMIIGDIIYIFYVIVIIVGIILRFGRFGWECVFIFCLSIYRITQFWDALLWALRKPQYLVDFENRLKEKQRDKLEHKL